MEMRKLTGKAAILAAVICTAALPSYADTTAPDFVTSEAVFWLDASALTETASTQLDSWADVRGGSYPGVTTYTDTKPQVIEIASGALAGKKAVTFFTQGTNCDMEFADVKAIRTFFMVADFDQSNTHHSSAGRQAVLELPDSIALSEAPMEPTNTTTPTLRGRSGTTASPWRIRSTQECLQDINS